MIFRVTPDPRNPSRGTLRLGARPCDCALGQGGVRPDKREGDGATPAGRFPLRRVLYRADRGAAPATALATARISPNDGWCDDPAAAAYNTQVTLPMAAGAERLWRADGIYDIVVVIGHNDAPVVPGAGSAIFIHIARAGLAPTEGCVALAHDDLLALLAEAGPGDALEIEEPAAP